MPKMLKAAPLRMPHPPGTLLGALIAARRAHGGRTPILQDDDGEPLSYDKLVRAVFALSARITAMTAAHERVGVLLPTTAPAVITFFALQAAGRTAVMLNYGADAASLEAACKLAGVKRVLSSKRFIERAQLKDKISALKACAMLVHLEDVKQDISLIDKLAAGARGLLPALAPAHARPEDAAVILFTSGTTGTPKGVALSHANLVANVEQCRQHIPFQPDWVVFNALPLFHSFGLTGGALLPILGGMKVMLHASPLDHKRIPELIRKAGANVLISTDSFARLYARAAEKGDLANLKFIVLGGERVNHSTRRQLDEKSPAQVLQGYGVTECAPVIAVNQPEHNRPGAVGKLLPGMEARLEKMEGVTIGEQLFVRGPNVMMGYLDPQRGGEIAPPEGGWVETGDLVRIDDEGYVTITGRAKRFAKVGAEMVSLEAVEEHAREVWPEGRHAAIAVSGDGDGESIVLVTDHDSSTRDDFIAWAREHHTSQLGIPRQVLVVDELPIIATGKPDYEAVRRIVKERLHERVV